MNKSTDPNGHHITFEDTIRWANDKDNRLKGTNSPYIFWIVLGSALLIILVLWVILMFYQKKEKNSLDEMTNRDNEIDFDDDFDDDFEYPKRSRGSTYRRSPNYDRLPANRKQSSDRRQLRFESPKNTKTH